VRPLLKLYFRPAVPVNPPVAESVWSIPQCVVLGSLSLSPPVPSLSLSPPSLSLSSHTRMRTCSLQPLHTCLFFPQIWQRVPTGWEETSLRSLIASDFRDFEDQNDLIACRVELFSFDSGFTGRQAAERYGDGMDPGISGRM
jgi:hypothetical protein